MDQSALLGCTRAPRLRMLMGQVTFIDKTHAVCSLSVTPGRPKSRIDRSGQVDPGGASGEHIARSDPGP